MKKIIPILILTAALILSACGGPFNGKEAEVEGILRPLIEREAILLGYLYGDSFETMNEIAPEDAQYTATAKYYRVSEDSPYHSIDQLKGAIREVYSEDRAKEIESGLFENTGGFARFSDYNVTNVAGEVTGIDLGIDVTMNHPPRELFIAVHPDTVEILRSTSNLIECRMEYTDSRNGNRETLTVQLVSEDGQWRLDDSTWAGSVQ